MTHDSKVASLKIFRIEKKLIHGINISFLGNLNQSKRINKDFFYVRVFNPFARSYGNARITKACKIKEKEKKRQYNERNLSIDHGSFSSLVFIAMGGLGRECKLFYNRLS